MRTLLLVTLFLVSPMLFATDLYMVRTRQSFPEAMAMLQEKISDKGYQVSRVQRVDIGLTASGYQTDKYRVVFFAKLSELRDVVARHPFLQPYLPLKIALFAEGEDTIMLASSFSHLRPFYADTDIQVQFDIWENDINEILEGVRVAD